MGKVKTVLESIIDKLNCSKNGNKLGHNTVIRFSKSELDVLLDLLGGL